MATYLNKMILILILLLSIPSQLITQKLSGDQESINSNKEPFLKDNESIHCELILNENQILDLSKTDAGGGIRNTLWPDGIVYYEIDTTFSSKDLATILEAMSEWEEGAPIKFIKRSDEKNYLYVKFRNSGIAVSGLGMGNGKQHIMIGDRILKRVMLHEIGHTLGLHHEHQRSDRDLYINVYPENMISNYASAITIKYPTLNVTPYDFLSIMHYSRLSFTSNFNNTIEPKPEYMHFLRHMGVVDKLSKYDKEGIQILYSFIPVLVSPTNNATSISQKEVILEWKSFWGAQGYNVQIALDYNFNNIIIDKNVFFERPRVEGQGYEIYSTTVENLTANRKYYWRVKQISEIKEYNWSSVNNFVVSNYIYSFDKSEDVLQDELFQNYPNPFNSTSTIRFYNSKIQPLRVNLFNSIGEQVKLLFEGRGEKGIYSFQIDAGELPSGIYYYRLMSNDYTETKKLIILR
jgi:hypothetical protein